jgi:alpha-beta hydrolase superfamily lysophospholipase
LDITADYYFIGYRKPLIILCHQAGWSRGEYNEIAPKLNAIGYNCLAIDQRSGGEVNGVLNETARQAKNKKLPREYLNAEQDIVAAVKWAQNKHPVLILWGSSYSASLVLKVAQKQKSIAKVLSFSPGEYFGKALTLKETINELQIPVFITCSKKEISRTQEIVDAIPSNTKTFFKPKTEGNHGSRALYEKFEDSGDYWFAVEEFLNK